MKYKKMRPPPVRKRRRRLVFLSLVLPRITTDPVRVFGVVKPNLFFEYVDSDVFAENGLEKTVFRDKNRFFGDKAVVLRISRESFFYSLKIRSIKHSFLFLSSAIMPAVYALRRSRIRKFMLTNIIYLN